MSGDLQACNFIKERLQHKCFLVNIEKFLRTAFYRTPQAAASVDNSGLTGNDLYGTICITLIRFLYDSTTLNV